MSEGDGMAECGMRLADLPLTLRAAWHEAQAYPHRADEILSALIADVRQLSAENESESQEADRQIKARDAAIERISESAERRIRRDLDVVTVSQVEDGFDPNGYFVYCLWGSDRDSPLYVGLSRNVLSRLGDHLGNRSRRYSVHQVSLVRCKTESAMIATEARLIRKYQPPWNVLGIVDKEGAAW